MLGAGEQIIAPPRPLLPSHTYIEGAGADGRLLCHFGRIVRSNFCHTASRRKEVRKEGSKLRADPDGERGGKGVLIRRR